MKQVESSPGRKASKIRTIAVENTAQAYLEILQDRGVRYIFGNGGTDFAPILDAFARRSVLGRASDAPVPIIVPHENVAMSMAHGAYLVSGELQVVMVHVGVGTANSLVGVINASRTNIPILLTAGRTPITEEGQLGSRNNYINWGQECFDQAGMLREYVKWDYELRNCEQLETVVDRAMEVAMAEPRGPVYLTLPREVLGAECQSMEITSPARHHTSARRFPDSESIREAAQILMDARSPLLITSSIGSSAEGVRQLVDLVDAFSIPVVIMPKISRYMNFPSNHPLHLGYDSHPFLADADVIVVLESDTPWYPSRAKPRADAQIIHIAEDPWYVRYPIRGYPCDLAISANPAVALSQLRDEMLRLAANKPEAMAAVAERRSRFELIHNNQRAEWQAERLAVENTDPIDQRWVSYCIGQVTDRSTRLVNDYGFVPEQAQHTIPGSLFGNSPAGGLGWGLGAALGIKLADPGSRVIAVVGDGSYMFASPLAAHFVAAKYSLPILTVICNNARWGAVRSANLAMYPNGWAQRTGHFAFSDLQPTPNFEEVVKCCGGYGERVERARDLPNALSQALKALDKGQQAVLNVICK